MNLSLEAKIAGGAPLAGETGVYLGGKAGTQVGSRGSWTTRKRNVFIESQQLSAGIFSQIQQTDAAGILSRKRPV